MPMPRRFLNKLFADHSIRDGKSFGIFGEFIHDGNLWHMNKRSVAGACSIGLFSAFIPIPFQMLLAAGLAIIFRFNLPISVALVWVTNPITMPPLFFLAYKVGTWLTDVHPGPFEFELSLNWLFTELRGRWRPFLAGCLFVGSLSGMVGYISARIFWRIHVISFWKNRKLRQQKNNLAAKLSNYSACLAYLLRL